MRAAISDGADDGDTIVDYLPAIRPFLPGEPGSVRHWFVLRYRTAGEKVFRRVLDLTGVTYQIFMFYQEMPRSKPVLTHWLPGYAFISLNIEDDPWHELLHIPSAIGFLGSPTCLDDDEYRELSSRLGSKRKNPEPIAYIKVGEAVMINAGPFTSFPGVVVSFDERRKMAELDVMIFGHTSKATVAYANISKG